MLSFLKSEALHPADFTIREHGVVRLNPELARRVEVRLGAWKNGTASGIPPIKC